MKSAEVIPFNRSNHLLKKAQALLDNMDLFYSDTLKGVTCLLDALPYCEPEMMLKVLPLLGYAGKDRVLWTLYRLILEPEQDEQIRFLVHDHPLGVLAIGGDDDLVAEGAQGTLDQLHRRCGIFGNQDLGHGITLTQGLHHQTATGATRLRISLMDSNRYSILLTSKELIRL